MSRSTYVKVAEEQPENYIPGRCETIIMWPTRAKNAVKNRHLYLAKSGRLSCYGVFYASMGCAWLFNGPVRNSIRSVDRFSWMPFVESRFDVESFVSFSISNLFNVHENQSSVVLCRLIH